MKDQPMSTDPRALTVQYAQAMQAQVDAGHLDEPTALACLAADTLATALHDDMPEDLGAELLGMALHWAQIRRALLQVEGAVAAVTVPDSPAGLE
jgi:hypothetical protein